MNVGMLWMGADKKRPLIEKVKRAADYYANKYGRQPTLCMVNAASLSEKMRVGSVLVEPSKTVLLHHFWLGVDDKP